MTSDCDVTSADAAAVAVAAASGAVTSPLLPVSGVTSSLKRLVIDILMIIVLFIIFN